MDLPPLETLDYAPPADANGSRAITRLLLVTAMVLSSLLFTQGALMVVDLASVLNQLFAEPPEDWSSVIMLIVQPVYAIGGLLVIPAAIGIWRGNGHPTRTLRTMLAAGLGFQAVAALLEGVVVWDLYWIAIAGDWAFHMSYMGPSLVAPPAIVSGLTIPAVYFTLIPDNRWRAVRLVLIGTFLVAGINIFEAAITLPAHIATADAIEDFFTGRATWMRQRPITLGLGGTAAVIAIVAALLRPWHGWSWLLVGGLAVQAIGLGIFWTGWFPSGTGMVRRQGASFDTVSTAIYMMVNPTFVLCLVTALAIFFALPAVRGAMAPRSVKGRAA